MIFVEISDFALNRKNCELMLWSCRDKRYSRSESQLRLNITI